MLTDAELTALAARNGLTDPAGRIDPEAVEYWADDLRRFPDGHGDKARVAALLETVLTLKTELASKNAAVARHHAQRADDRCVEDDAALYAAFGLPPHDPRVGDKFAMLLNCARFIERRCAGGGWPTYAELEAAARRRGAVLRTCQDVLARIKGQLEDGADCRYLLPDVENALRYAADALALPPEEA